MPGVFFSSMHPSRCYQICDPCNMRRSRIKLRSLHYQAEVSSVPRTLSLDQAYGPFCSMGYGNTVPARPIRRVTGHKDPRRPAFWQLSRVTAGSAAPGRIFAAGHTPKSLRRRPCGATAPLCGTDSHSRGRARRFLRSRRFGTRGHTPNPPPDWSGRYSTLPVPMKSSRRCHVQVYL